MLGRLSLLFLLLFSITAYSQIDNYQFQAQIFKSIDLMDISIEKENIELLYKGIDHIKLAHMAANSDAAKEKMNEVVNDILLIQDFKEPKELVKALRSKLRWAIKLNRNSITLDTPGEKKFLENLIKAHLFPEIDPTEINIKFEGPRRFTRSRGLLIMATFISFPSSIRYDEEVKELITGTDFDGAKSKYSVGFSQSAFAKTKTRKEASTIRELLNKIFEHLFATHQLKSPMKIKMMPTGDRYILSLEAIGHQGAKVLSYMQPFLAHMAHENTSYRLIEFLDNALLYVTQLNVPFDSAFFKAPLKGAEGGLKFGKLVLEGHRNAAISVNNTLFKEQTPKSLKEKFITKMDSYIKAKENALSKLGGAGTEMAHGEILESTIERTAGSPLRTFNPRFGAEGDGSEKLLSRKEKLLKDIAELKKIKAERVAAMDAAILKLEQGGVELPVQKVGDKWVASKQLHMYSPAEHEEYLRYQLQENEAYLEKIEQELRKSDSFKTELKKLEQAKQKTIKNLTKEFELAYESASAEERAILEQTHKKNLAKAETKFLKGKQDLLIKSKSRWHIRRGWNIKQAFKDIKTTKETLKNLYQHAAVRAENLKALTPRVANARKAIAVARASGPFWSRYSVFAWNADRGMIFVSGLFAAIHIYHWQVERSRAKTDDEKYYLWENYGPKIFHMLFYCIPGAQEVAFATDLSYLLISSIFYREVGKLNGTEVMLRGLMHFGESIGYWSEGISRWDIGINKLSGSMGLAPFITDKTREKPMLTNGLLVSFRQSMEELESGEKHFEPDPKDPEKLIEVDLSSKGKILAYMMRRRLNFIRGYQSLTQRYIGGILRMNHIMGSQFASDRIEWVYETEEKFFGREGFTPNLLKVFAESDKLIDKYAKE